RNLPEPAGGAVPLPDGEDGGVDGPGRLGRGGRRDSDLGAVVPGIAHRYGGGRRQPGGDPGGAGGSKETLVSGQKHGDNPRRLCGGFREDNQRQEKQESR